MRSKGKLHLIPKLTPNVVVNFNRGFQHKESICICLDPH